MERLKTLDFYISEYKPQGRAVAKKVLGNVSETDILPRIVWDENNVIIHANQQFLDGLGYKYTELVGKKWVNDDGTSDFISPDTLPKSLDDVFRNIVGGIIFLTETRNEWIAKNGRTVPIKWAGGFNNAEFGVGSAQCEFIK